MKAAVEVVRRIALEWREDRVSGLAAEVAFFALLSLFPTLLAVTAALGSIEAVAGRDVAARAEAEVIDFLRRVLTDEAADTVDAVEGLFRDSNPGIVTIGVVSALWAASRGFAAVVNALDVVYDLDDRRSYLVRRAVGLGLAVGTIAVTAVMLAMLVVGPLLGTGREIADDLGLGGAFATLWNWFRWPVAVSVMVAWAATVFHVGPNHRTPWRWDLPGAVLTAVAWALLSIGLRVYLSVAVGTDQVLGLLGGTLIVMLWFYLLAAGLLLGGELNAVLVARAGLRDADVPGAGPGGRS
ncbi:MAG TPA: YihY/virulence factor BrkB family protein [Acidimicrobiales bacterium]